MASARKLEGLDGLRGLAALVVLAHHNLHHAGIDWFGRGYLAVDLFFMLSGIVIAVPAELVEVPGSLVLRVLDWGLISVITIGASHVALRYFDEPVRHWLHTKLAREQRMPARTRRHA